MDGLNTGNFFPGLPQPYSDRFVSQIWADKVLYQDGELGLGWTVAITVPDLETWTLTNLWFWHDSGSDVAVRVRYTPKGAVAADKYIIWGRTLTAAYPTYMLSCIQKVLEGGSEIAVYAGVASVLNVCLEGQVLVSQ